MTKYAVYRAVLKMLIILTVLTVMCLVWVEKGEPSYYLCVFTLIINLTVIAFIVVRLIIAYVKHDRLDTQLFELPERKKKK